MWTYNTYDELYHHGIKGQKWGQRRFQNDDGSLTPDGRIRYGVSNVKNRASAAGKTIKNRISTTGKTVKEGVSNKWNGLSDKQKKAIKIGAAIAGTALAAYAGYKIADGIITKNGIKAANRIIDEGRKTTNNILSASMKDHKDIVDLNLKIGNNERLANATIQSARNKEEMDEIWNARKKISELKKTREQVSFNSSREGKVIGNDGKLYTASSYISEDGSYNYSFPNADKLTPIRTKDELRRFKQGYKITRNK